MKWVQNTHSTTNKCRRLYTYMNILHGIPIDMSIGDSCRRDFVHLFTCDLHVGCDMPMDRFPCLTGKHQINHQASIFAIQLKRGIWTISCDWIMSACDFLSLPLYPRSNHPRPAISQLQFRNNEIVALERVRASETHIHWIAYNCNGKWNRINILTIPNDIGPLNGHRSFKLI